MKYKTIHHCHLDPHHGKPVHDYKNGTARCKWCGWEAKLVPVAKRQAKSDPSLGADTLGRPDETWSSYSRGYEGPVPGMRDRYYWD